MNTARGYVAYVRVSTPRQGQKGVSLQEQRAAILEYARRKALTIERWIEERETAAKTGRPQFTEMMRLLRSGQAAGLILHKIDRGARNLQDWAQIEALSKDGLDVRSVCDDIDLSTRGGRLGANIQAVVASDYITNLREEALKGIRGRLKQGIYPFRAPIGYLDQGAGKAKVPDPATAHFIRDAFALYDRGTFSLITLRDELERRGLRNRKGTPVSLNGLSTVLRSRFYTGLIRIKRTGESYAGIHEPLVTQALFERVQARLDGKINTRITRHEYRFRRLLRCAECHYSLIGERQKGHVYYRCHTAGCPTTTVREETVDACVAAVLKPLHFTGADREYLRRRSAALWERWGRDRQDAETALSLRTEQIASRLDRLTDAYIDRLLDKETFERRKDALLKDQIGLNEQRRALQDDQIPHRVEEYLELAGTASLLYEFAKTPQQRKLLEVITSNRSSRGRSVEMVLAPPFALLAECGETPNGRPYRGRPRTLDRFLSALIEFFRLDETRPPLPDQVRELLHFNKDTADDAEGASA
jgi:site-specific DNA recombinase